MGRAVLRRARQSGPAGSGPEAAVRLAARNSGTNSYHHAGHFAHVIMAAGVLAAMAGIMGGTVRFLVLAGLFMTLIIRGGAGRSALLAGRLVGPPDRSCLLGRGGDARLAPDLAE